MKSHIPVPIDKNKVYTKEEFEKLMKKYFLNLIQSFEFNDKGKFFDYYTVPGYPLTGEQEKSNKYGYMYLLRHEDIGKIEFFSETIAQDNPKKVPPEFIKSIDKHHIKDDKTSFYHGYMQGIYSVIRYLKNKPEDLGAKREDLWKGLFLKYID